MYAVIALAGSGLATAAGIARQASDPWQPYVGIGTLALALTTGVLAFATFRMAGWTRKTAEAALEDVRASAQLVKAAGEQTRANKASAKAAGHAAGSAAEQVKLTRMAMETQIRPVIVDVPVRGTVGQVVIQDGPATITCSVHARNVGSGTAFIRSMSISIRPDLDWPGALSNAIVPPGEGTRVTFSIPKDRSDLSELVTAVQGGTFCVWFGYTDISGGQDTLTRLDIHRDPVRVRQVYLFKPGDSEPFLSSGPAGD